MADERNGAGVSSRCALLLGCYVLPGRGWEGVRWLVVGQGFGGAVHVGYGPDGCLGG